MDTRLRFFNHTWFWILAGGLAVFFVTEQALKYTSNPNFFPTVIISGSFLVPVAFVAYIYERVPAHELSLTCMTICFIGGGVVGTVTAGVLEFTTLRGMTIFGLVGVGFIEELCKLLFPSIQYVRARYRSEADGLLFGVASGMGFAALETMGYGLVTLIQSQGNIGSLEELLLIRGLLSPAGHAAWTGLVCAVLWKERQKRGKLAFVSLPVILTFALAVALHTLWNFFNSLNPSTTAGVVVSIGGNIAVAGISLVLLLRRVKESTKPSLIKLG